MNIIAKKVGMTNTYTPSGRSIPCTIVQIGSCTVTQVKEAEKDGYDAIQLAYQERKVKHVTKPLQGHFKKANTTPKQYLREFSTFTKVDGTRLQLGDVLEVKDCLKEGDLVNITSTSKGKGFQGVMRRHGFKGGQRTHGQHNRDRAPGSIGAASYPSRVFKGILMAGQMGNKKTHIKGLKVIKIMSEDNLLILSGPVPGAKHTLLTISAT